jgi:hypothetical protein
MTPTTLRDDRAVTHLRRAEASQADVALRVLREVRPRKPQADAVLVRQEGPAQRLLAAGWLWNRRQLGDELEQVRRPRPLRNPSVTTRVRWAAARSADEPRQAWWGLPVPHPQSSCPCRPFWRPSWRRRLPCPRPPPSGLAGSCGSGGANCAQTAQLCSAHGGATHSATASASADRMEVRIPRPTPRYCGNEGLIRMNCAQCPARADRAKRTMSDANVSSVRPFSLAQQCHHRTTMT